MNELSERIKQSRAERKPFVARNMFYPLPNWDYFINYIDYAVKSKNMHRTVGNYYFVLEVFDKDIDFTNHAYKNIYEILNEAHPIGIQTRPVFLVSLLGEVPNLGLHADPCDQMHISCINSNRWSIKLDNGEIVQYTLGPGDLMFIPTGLEHMVESDMPRAGITFSAHIE